MLSEGVNEFMLLDKEYEIAKSILTDWEVEIGCNEVVATFSEGLCPAYHATVYISQGTNNDYTVKLTCRFANRLSASCSRIAHTDEELEGILGNLRDVVSNHLFDGLEEKLNASLKEYLHDNVGHLFWK